MFSSSKSLSWAIIFNSIKHFTKIMIASKIIDGKFKKK